MVKEGLGEARSSSSDSREYYNSIDDPSKLAGEKTSVEEQKSFSFLWPEGAAHLCARGNKPGFFCFRILPTSLSDSTLPESTFFVIM